MTFTTRFAPSPTGLLHLGHAFSALLAHDMARAANGRFLLRIEDIDQTRSRSEWEARIYDDLRWLGLRWDNDPLRQTERLPAYGAALDRLWAMGLLYPCHCSRRDILEAASAPQEGADWPLGPDGLVYPGTCRPDMAPDGPRPHNVALRLDVQRACAALGNSSLSFSETGSGPDGETDKIVTKPAQYAGHIGDVVLSRRDFLGSYHLSVVLDDAAQKITHVVRGQDLFEATRIHVLLQALLELPCPFYHHHRLIRDEYGRRLAKRDDARAIATYRSEGMSPADIRQMVGL